jgi:serine/threonine protein kinase
MLVLQCLFVEDSIDLAPLDQESVDYFLNETFSTHADKVSCSGNGYDFIRSCLSHDPARRPTAQQALRHAWLCEPREDLELFERRQKQFAACRRPRSVNVPVIQYIDCGDNGNRMRFRAQAASEPDVDGTVSAHFS